MKKKLLLFLFIVIVVYAYYDGGIGPLRSGDFRIAYANINSGNGHSLAVSRAIRQTDADVILVMEWTGNNLDPIELLSSGYKVVMDSPGNGTHGVLLLAKKTLGITSMMVDNPVPGPCGMPVLTSSLQYKSTLITILGVHAPPPLKACKNTTDKTVSYFAGLVSHGRLDRKFGVGRKGDAVIIVGDLNTLPFNHSIDNISHSGLVDAHRDAGHFLGATWAPFYVLPRVARIDYVFNSPELKIRKLWNTRIPGSDHNLLVADYALNGNAK